MFRIEFFVDDKKLPQALIALTHIARGAPNVTPVVNATANGANGITAAGSSKGVERFVGALKKHKGKMIASPQVKEIMKTLGLNPGSASYFIKSARDAGALQKYGIGSKTSYKVL